MVTLSTLPGQASRMTVAALAAALGLYGLISVIGLATDFSPDISGLLLLALVGSNACLALLLSPVMKVQTKRVPWVKRYLSVSLLAGLAVLGGGAVWLAYQSAVGTVLYGHWPALLVSGTLLAAFLAVLTLNTVRQLQHLAALGGDS